MTGPTLRSGAATHVGMIRTMNEDAYAVLDRVFAVADGMGGHLAGEVASSLAIDTLAALDGDVTVDAVVNAVLEANDRILHMSRTDASRRGMGTTLTVLALVRPSAAGSGSTDAAEPAPELAVVNLGDSRTYRFRGGTLQQISVDHSYVQELVAAGHLTPEEARHHPQRNIVTRALGIEPDVGVDVWSLPAVRGDRFLLCSDGLVDEVLDDNIADVLAHVPDPQDAAEQLVAMANGAGGRDNVTVVVIDVLEGADVAGAGDDTTPVPMIGHDDTPVHTPLPAPTLTGPAGTPDDVHISAVAGTDAGEPGGEPGDDPSLATGDDPTANRWWRRLTDLRFVGVFGGVAILVAIIIVAVKGPGGGQSPDTTIPVGVTTTVVAGPATTTPPAPTTNPGVTTTSTGN